jgi:hypothetical protein
LRRRVVLPFVALLFSASLALCQQSRADGKPSRADGKPSRADGKPRSADGKKIHVRDSPTYDAPDSLTGCDDDDSRINGESPASLQMADRNALVRKAESEVLDLERVYLSKIQTGRSWIYTSLDVLSLAATAAGGAVGGPTAAKELVLTATGIAGVKSSFVTNFDAGGNATSLVGKIQTAFASNQVLLEQNLNLSYASYSLSAACFDVQALYDSGQKVSTGAKVTGRAALPPGSDLRGIVYREVPMPAAQNPER